MATTRRAALVAAPALVVAGPTMAALHPDAELIQLCGEACRLYDHCSALPAGVELDDNCREWVAFEVAEARAKAMPATTLEGLLAKAAVAHRWARQPDGTFDYSDHNTGDWPGLVVQDFLRMAGVAA